MSLNPDHVILCTICGLEVDRSEPHQSSIDPRNGDLAHAECVSTLPEAQPS